MNVSFVRELQTLFGWTTTGNGTSAVSASKMERQTQNQRKKMSEPQLNDPVFYDDSDFTECDECGTDFDRNLYNSPTCEECENEQE